MTSGGVYPLGGGAAASETGETVLAIPQRFVAIPALLMLAGTACAQDFVFPTLAHAANNLAPFDITDAPGITHHQVYASSLFAAVYAGAPVRIERVAYAPSANVTFDSHVVIRLGYTPVQPPAAPAAPVEGGGGAPNATGPMHQFYSDRSIQAFTSAGSSNFQMQFAGTPFVYDPALGNLLVETVVTQRVVGAAVSRAAGSAESTRSYTRHGGAVTISPTTALRTQFTVSPGGPTCYANCDSSTQAPVLNVQDFTCFLQRYAAGESYANCDSSTVAPVLNVQDFTCFLQAYAAGCP
jgi:hypothetical protein